MWLVFDQLWSAPSGIAMRNEFASACGYSLSWRVSRYPTIYEQRSNAATLFEKLNANSTKYDLLPMVFFSNSVPLGRKISNYGVSSAAWQPELRTLFVMRIASWKYRAQVPGFELPAGVRVRQAAYDEQSARILEGMADCIEKVWPPVTFGSGDSAQLLNCMIAETLDEESRGLPAGQAQSFIALMRRIDGLTTSLASEIKTEFARRH